MNQFSRIVILGAALVALLACAGADAARKSKELLQYIPADTPYVLAFTKPFPDDLTERFEVTADKTLAAYRTIIDYYMAEAIAEADASEDDEGAAAAEKMQAFMVEFKTLLSVQGLRDAGVGRDALFAMYGDGILPVIRIALTDNEAFEATIARLEAKVEEEFLTGEIGKESYRYLDIDEFRLIIATPGDDAVIAIVPGTTTDARLSEVLGLQVPKDNLAKNRLLHDITREYGFTEHLVSFVDVERVAAEFLNDESGRNTEFAKAAGLDTSTLSAACRSELADIAAIAPRIVIGYTDVSNKALRASMVVELREDIASGAASLPAAVPGLGLDAGGLFSFGFSLNPLAARNFYEARLDAMEADPFECEHLADLQAGTAKGREALAQPVPPVVYSFRGFMANVTGLEGMDIATETPPESVDATILLAMENAQDLVMMAAMMDPQIAALNLLPDGKAKQLNLPQLATIAEQAFAALSESALSVSLGEDADTNAEAMLTADVQSPNPLMSFSMDAKKYYEFVGQAGLQEPDPDSDEPPMPPEVRNAMQDIMVSSGELYDRMSINVHLTKRGIEIDSYMTLSQ